VDRRTTGRSSIPCSTEATVDETSQTEVGDVPFFTVWMKYQSPG
jgi:hypothetical protein